MNVLPRLAGRRQLVLDVIFRVALLLLMAGIAIHTATADPARAGAVAQEAPQVRGSDSGS